MMSETEIECDTEGLPNNHDLTPVQCVFQNDLLLDKIFYFVLMNDDEEEKRKTINSCKLVQHFWLERVDAALRKSEAPKQNFVQLQFKHPWRIKRFVDAFANTPSTLVYRIPPFLLVYDGHVRWPLHETLLTDLLFRCGSALVKLTIYVYKKQWCYDLESLLSQEDKPLKLPKLERLAFTFWRRTTMNQRMYDLCARINLFIRTILDGCESLQDISFDVFNFFMDLEIVPHILENMNLPLTLTKVDLPWNSKPGLLAQLFLKNTLPNLITLKLCVECRSTYRDRIRASEFETVLAQFRHQLLELHVVDYNSVQRDGLKITLPVMERLKMFICRTKSIEWSTPDSQSLDFCFPALTTIRLPERSVDMNMLQTWTQNATFCLVEKGTFYLEQPIGCKVPDDLLLLGQMRQIKQSFHNIRDLTITIPFDVQSSPISFIFREMRQLQKLIIFITNCPRHFKTREFHDWFLESNPHQEFRVFPAQGESWMKFTQDNMKDLTTLEIHWRPVYYDRYETSMYSYWTGSKLDDEKNDRDIELECEDYDTASEESELLSQDGSSSEENDEDSDVEGTKDYENDSNEENDEDSDVEGTKDYEIDSNEENDDW